MESNGNFIKKTEKHLLIIIKGQGIEDHGDLKLTINVHEKMLIVTPKNEKYPSFSTSFDSDLVQHKNILFVFSEKHNFAMILETEDLCTKVHDILSRNKIKVFQRESNDRFFQKFLKPLCQTVLKKPKVGYLQQILIDMEKEFDCEEKKKLLNLLKKEIDVNFYQTFLRSLTNTNNQNNGCSKAVTSQAQNFDALDQLNYEPASKKRRTIPTLNQTFSNNKISKLKPFKNFQIIKKPMFEWLFSTDQAKNPKYKRLLIFTSNKKDFCYFYEQKCGDSWICMNCCKITTTTLEKFGKYVVAKILIDKNDEEIIETNLKDHICKPFAFEQLNKDGFVKETTTNLKKSTLNLNPKTQEILQKNICEPPDFHQTKKFVFSDTVYQCYIFFGLSPPPPPPPPEAEAPPEALEAPPEARRR